MGWGTSLKKSAVGYTPIVRPTFKPMDVDWSRVVTLDFETYFDDDYTLRKMSAAEYIRDKRFEALMCGINIGGKKTNVALGHQRIKTALSRINWNTHILLAHHTQFDGLILSEHFDVHPYFMMCTLSMARGLHSNEIGAGLHEVSMFYGGYGKSKGSADDFKGLRFKDLAKTPDKLAETALYCSNDVDECLRVAKHMVPVMPVDEMGLIDMTCRMYTEPVLRVDVPRVEKELVRIRDKKRELLISTLGTKQDVDQMRAEISAQVLRGKLPKKFQGWTAEEILQEKARARIGSSEQFAELLRAEGVTPPTKLSPTYVKKRMAGEEADPDKKFVYAFAKTDLEFTQLLEHPKQRVRELAECRLSVKSSGDETRAERFLTLGRNGGTLPVYLKYATAHTLRWGGGDGTNMQNLRRKSELRLSILAPSGYVLVVVDSGQIEARVNAWLWGQDDLLDAFRRSDAYEAAQMLLPESKRKIARGADRDAYCQFADSVYGFEVTKKDTDQRFVGKVSVLGLGYGMGPPKFQNTLALGTMGPPVFFELDMCQKIVYTYRRLNHKIVEGWNICNRIIEDMAVGRAGSYKCLSWGKDQIFLPNGMSLKYPGLRRRMNQETQNVDWIYQKKDGEAKIYGSLLCENIVQALARLIVGEQLLRINPKYRVVMTTHDEGVSLARKSQGPKALEFMLKVFKTPPSWCSDIPLNAEGGFDVNYSK